MATKAARNLKKWPLFKLSQLKKLPNELRGQGEELRLAYSGFQKAAFELLARLGVDIEVTYPSFLENRIIDLTREVWTSISEIADSERMQKERWFEKSLHLVLASIVMGHRHIDRAYLLLIQDDTAGFSRNLAGAGVQVGRLSMILDLMDEGVYERIGSIQSAIAGATLGGMKSGETRRKQSRVPTPEALRTARQKLLDAGKPSREICAMLARKYDCTADHIRKILQRD